MLEKIPSPVGEALKGVRAGFDTLVSEQPAFRDAPDVLGIESDAFEEGAFIPVRYTYDGERISPPLRFSGAPDNAASLVLIIEDPDAPQAHPFLHLLVWDLPPDLTDIPEGQFSSPHHEGMDENLGRNSFLLAEYLPMDTPPGHGAHHYVFQLFALDRRLNFDHHPTREQVEKAMEGHVIAKGRLTGLYQRD